MQKLGQRNRSSACLRCNQNSKEFGIISNVPLKRNAKPTINPTFYSSYNITEPSMSTVENKRLLKPAYFKKYDNTTQISYLPGAVKRGSTEIKDDIKSNNYPRENTYSFKEKVFREHNTNIACLPGCKVNKEERKVNLVAPNDIKYRANDIFNVDNARNYNNDFNNTFNVSHKKRFNGSRKLYGASDMNNCYLNEYQGGIRRGYKNVSQIQII